MDDFWTPDPENGHRIVEESTLLRHTSSSSTKYFLECTAVACSNILHSLGVSYLLKITLARMWGLHHIPLPQDNLWWKTYEALTPEVSRFFRGTWKFVQKDYMKHAYLHSHPLSVIWHFIVLRDRGLDKKPRVNTPQKILRIVSKPPRFFTPAFATVLSNITYWNQMLFCCL